VPEEAFADRGNDTLDAYVEAFSTETRRYHRPDRDRAMN
jgi:hypothetical protein